MDPPSSELLLSFYLLVAHHDDDDLPLLLWEPWHTPDLSSGVCTSAQRIMQNLNSFQIFNKTRIGLICGNKEKIKLMGI